VCYGIFPRSRRFQDSGDMQRFSVLASERRLLLWKAHQGGIPKRSQPELQAILHATVPLPVLFGMSHQVTPGVGKTKVACTPDIHFFPVCFSRPARSERASLAQRAESLPPALRPPRCGAGPQRNRKANLPSRVTTKTSPRVSPRFCRWVNQPFATVFDIGSWHRWNGEVAASFAMKDRRSLGSHRLEQEELAGRDSDPRLGSRVAPRQNQPSCASGDGKMGREWATVRRIPELTRLTCS
jgi:hypothetical protein